MKKIILVLGCLFGLVAGLSAEVLELANDPIVDADIQTRYYVTSLNSSVVVENEQSSSNEQLSFMFDNYDDLGTTYVGFVSSEKVEEGEIELDEELVKDLLFFFENKNVNYFEQFCKGGIVFLFWKNENGHNIFMTGFKM